MTVASYMFLKAFVKCSTSLTNIYLFLTGTKFNKTVSKNWNVFFFRFTKIAFDRLHILLFTLFELL